MTATTTPVEHPARKPDVERWLDDRDVLWCFEPALSVSSIDAAKSRANQARLGEPVVPEMADRYAAAMRRGDVFPPVLAYRPSRRARKVWLLGGNHRHEAAVRAGLEVLPAYVVECEPELATALCYEDNARHGLPPSTRERVQQAIHLVALGWQAEAAAAAVGVTAPQVSTARKAAEGSRRAKELGVPGFDTIVSEGKRAELARIGSDAVFEAATRLVVRAGLSHQDVSGLVKRVKAARSEQQALQVVSDAYEDHRSSAQRTAGGRAKKATSTPYGTLLSALLSVADCRPLEVAASCPTPEARTRLRQMIRARQQHLEAIEKALR